MVAGNKKATFNIAPRVIARDLLKVTMQEGRFPSLTKAGGDPVRNASENLCARETQKNRSCNLRVRATSHALCCEEPDNRPDSRRRCIVSITQGGDPSATVQETKLEVCPDDKDVTWKPRGDIIYIEIMTEYIRQCRIAKP